MLEKCLMLFSGGLFVFCIVEFFLRVMFILLNVVEDLSVGFDVYELCDLSGGGMF